MGKPEIATVEAALGKQAGASFTLHGAGVSGGIAIGYAHLITSARLEVAHYEIAREDIDAEIVRLDAAVEQVRGELIGLHASVPADAPAEMGAFLDLHLMILNDAMLSVAPRELIRTRRWNAEWALVHQMEILVHRFEEIEDAYLRERKADVQQVVERVLKGMLGTGHLPEAPEHEENIIVVAHDFSPADMILFKQHQFAGFVTDVGGVTSHTAIVARSLNIPAIVGLHHARQMIREGELLIADGSAGVLIVNPDRQVLAEYQLRQGQFELERQKLKRLKTTPAATLEGVTVELQANIELPEDVEQALEVGAMGVGLFRSEFLFLNRDDLPDEDEQFESYRQVGAGDGRAPGHHPHARPRRRQDDQRRAVRRPESGVGPARDPVLPRRAADVPHAAPGDPARVPLREGAIAGADDRARARDRPGDALRVGGAGHARAGRDPVRPGCPDRRHDRGAGRGARGRRASSRSSTSFRSAPTTSSSTRSRSTAPTTMSRTCTIRCIRRCCSSSPTPSARRTRPACRSRSAARWRARSS